MKIMQVQLTVDQIDDITLTNIQKACHYLKQDIRTLERKVELQSHEKQDLKDYKKNLKAFLRVAKYFMVYADYKAFKETL